MRRALKQRSSPAFIRNPMHVTQAARLGCDIATVPMNVLLQMLKHPLTDNGIDRFLKDSGRIHFQAEVIKAAQEACLK